MLKRSKILQTRTRKKLESHAMTKSPHSLTPFRVSLKKKQMERTLVRIGVKRDRQIRRLLVQMLFDPKHTYIETDSTTRIASTAIVHSINNKKEEVNASFHVNRTTMPVKEVSSLVTTTIIIVIKTDSKTIDLKISSNFEFSPRLNQIQH